MPSDIEWCDETLNPQGWGCWGPGGTPAEPRRCWYCYSKGFAKRHLSKCDLCNQFVPHWHPERLQLPYRWRRPRRIFWGSMGDLFHPFTPDWQILSALAVASGTPHHTHIFCTKNPARYQDFNPWPSNCWPLTTITNQADADQRIPELLKAEASVLGVSLEPFLEEVNLERIILIGDQRNIDPLSGYECEYLGSNGEGQAMWGNTISMNNKINWLIIGAMTGRGSKQHQPRAEWVRSLWEGARASGVPTFMKNNLKPLMGTLVQEWPIQ